MGSKWGGLGNPVCFPHFAPIYLDKVGKNALTHVSTGFGGGSLKCWWVVSGKLTKWGGCGDYEGRNYSYCS